MKIKILGVGCTRCQQLEKLAKEAVNELGLDTTVEEVRGIKQIMEYPILTTPGLVINEELACSGRIPTKGEVCQFIISALEKEEGAKKQSP